MSDGILLTGFNNFPGTAFIFESNFKRAYMFNVRYETYRRPLTGYEYRQVYNIYELAEFFKELEYEVFEYLMYPKVIYRRMNLVGTEKSDEEFIERFFLYLFSSFISPIAYAPMLEIIRYHERRYRAFARLHRNREIQNFHADTIKQIFLFIYEINGLLADPETAEKYLRRCL